MLVDGAAQAHGRACGHVVCTSGAYATLSVTVVLDPDLDDVAEEDARAVVRDVVTARAHELLAGTSDADCDVDFYPCSGLVTTDPPTAAPPVAL